MAARLLSSCARREQVPLLAPPARVPDHSCTAADQGDGCVAACLEAFEKAKLLQVPHVKAVRSRVETDVHGETPGVHAIRKAVLVGHLMDQTPPGQVLEEWGHRTSLPRVTSGPRLISSPPMAGSSRGAIGSYPPE